MCKWQALDKIHLSTRSSETNSLSALTGTCYTSQEPATSHIHIPKHTWSWIQSCDLTGRVFLGLTGFASGPIGVKHLLSLHQRSFQCLFHVLPTATLITADSHRQPAYSIQECTFAAYIHVLHSTKHYQNSRKERNWHTPDCSLKQFCKVCCCSQYRAESIMSPSSYAFIRFKKGTSALQQKIPSQ